MRSRSAFPTDAADSAADSGEPPYPPGADRLDVTALRKQFPILDQRVHGRPLVYLDSAASAQRPDRVLERIARYYRHEHANVHRGAHELSMRATNAYEDARRLVARYVGASDTAEIVFTRGTTEGINLVAQSWGYDNLSEDDEVVLTKLEHHSDIVPWQLAAARTGAAIRWIDVTPDGRLDLDHARELIGPRTRLVGVTCVSNGIGTINPVDEIVAMARDAGALVLMDGAQAAPHFPVDVTELGCDFFAFSGHKMCAPTGIGALWARRELLDAMTPYQGGGEMISSVTVDGSEWAEVPHKFEAGTPNIAGAVGFGEAVRFLEETGQDAIVRHERELVGYALPRLAEVEGLTLYGPGPDAPGDRVSVFSFTLGDIHPHDLATILDQQGIAIRSGHHCNQPLMDHLGLNATARASLYLYNSTDDVDALIEGLDVASRVFGGV